jgi:AraC-like DNA-binding protein
MPQEDMKLIVPNGMVKLTIPFCNGISGRYKDWFHLSKESALTLIGISDSPAIVDLEHDAPHGNIGIEFSPVGAYRILRLHQSEIRNKIFLLEEIMGKSARDIQEIIANTNSIKDKVQIIQSYLLTLVSKSEPDPILDYCVRLIEGTKGLVSLTELQRKTGYSSRWLYEKFMDKVGLSPKNLSSVVRFMHFYDQWAKNPGPDFFKKDIYDYFFDQAHFIKEFKRFTGHSPLRFAQSENEFGRIFYRE